MNEWQVGDVKITRIVEMELTGGNEFILPDATREACLPIDWMRPHFADGDGNLIMSIHALILDTGSRRIVVDTCVGNDKQRTIPNWTNMQTSFLDDLTAAGYPRESIDTVLCTHLHVDHVGWNTMWEGDGWIPTFPNARYLMAEEEWRYWDANEDEQEFGPVMADSVRPVVEAGLADFVSTHERICDEVRLEPTPGHTPAHVSVRIASKGQEALITGDCIHHPCQLARTEWCSPADYDQLQARSTREALLAQYADSQVLVIGTHFATPTAGYIKKAEGAGYRFEVE